MKKIIIILGMTITLCTLTACGNYTSNGNKRSMVYTVKDGETIQSIALKFGVKEDKLIEFSGYEVVWKGIEIEVPVN